MENEADDKLGSKAKKEIMDTHSKMPDIEKRFLRRNGIPFLSRFILNSKYVSIYCSKPVMRIKTGLRRVVRLANSGAAIAPKTMLERESNI